MTATLGNLWRLDPPTIGDSGAVVRGGMLPHQREWWDLPNFVRGLVTGYGGGKTFALGKRMIWLAYVNAPVPIITVSPTYPMARLTVVQTIDELLDGKVRDINARLRARGISGTASYRLFRSQPYRFAIDFGDGRRNEILCMSGEHPDRLKGSNVAAAGIDEPFIQDRAVFSQVMARIRHPRARRRELDITGTPEGVVGWGVDLFEGELRAKHDVGLVQCSSRANTALPQDYVQRLEDTFDERARAAYVEGKFVNLSTGMVYYGFDPTVNCIASDAIPDGAELGIGMDFNVNPMAFCVFWRKGDRVHFLREFEKPNSDTADACKEALDEFPAVRKIYPDSSGANRKTSGKSDFETIRSFGLQVYAKPANPLRRDRYNAVNSAMRKVQVTIGPRCRKLRSYLMAYTHENLNTDAQKAMSHLLDAFSYPIAYLLPADAGHAFAAKFSGA